MSVTKGSGALIIDAVRTPRGKAKLEGGLGWATPLELTVAVAQGLVDRTGVDPGAVDDLVLGCVTQTGDQGGNLARVAALTAGLDSVPGMTVNRFCASGLEAANLAAARLCAGVDDVILAGGVESVSHAPMYSDGATFWSDPSLAGGAGSVPMGIAADLVATMEGFGRDALDAYGAQTQQRAAAAWGDGHFQRSLVTLPAPAGRDTLEADEHVRPGTTVEQLAALPPAFTELGASGHDEVMLARYPGLDAIDHLHTRGTSPSLADAASLILLATPKGASAAGLEPRARVLASATAAVDPFVMLTAGQDATVAALNRAGVAPADVDLFEFAEAFAALCLRFQRDLDVDDDRFNVNGGTIAMGHAFGATGAILLTTLLDELERRDQRIGVVAVSGAAGLGSATVIERLS